MEEKKITIMNVISQADFCLDLMKRLNDSITHAKNDNCWGTMVIVNKTQMQEDIRRLRRELMDLQKML
jgi:hypothetical protein